MRLMAGAVMAMSMLAGAAHAGDWRLASVGRSAALAVDVSSVHIEGERATAWTAVLLPVTKSGFDYALVRQEYHCGASVSSQLIAIYYNERGREVSRSGDPVAPFPIDPNSNEWLLMEAVCSGQFQVNDAVGWSDARDLLSDFRTTPPQ